MLRVTEVIRGDKMAKNYCVCGKEAGISPVTGKPYKLCKECFKLFSKRNNKSRTHNRKVVVSKKIDIESLYTRLRNGINKRLEWQERQDDLWVYIKKTNNNRIKKMKKINFEIGKSTHEINKILNELTKYKKTHNAMNMAYNYLENEISRINKIINKWKKTVNDVEAGRKLLISADGTEDTDTRTSKNYIKKKEKQLSNYKKWREHVKSYLV